jgi:hypothetical protein
VVLLDPRCGTLFVLYPRRLRESWPFRYIEKNGDFFRLIWAEIFLHKSLTDSGISHRFLRLFSFYTIARRFEYLHICGIFTQVSKKDLQQHRRLPVAASLAKVAGTIGGVGVTTGSGRTDEKTSTWTRR